MDAARKFEEQVSVLRTTISCDLRMRLTNLLSQTHYNLAQCNGQRIYGPPPNWKGPRPPRGCEIFVGRLPRDAYEDELIPIFSRAGKIYELRLMMEFSGYTRGFCFVVYVNKDGANKAVQMLHLFEMRPNWKITVYRSLDNSRLFIGGIPYEKTRDEIWKAFNDVLDGITNIIMYPNPHDENKNRGYVFVDFISHKHAMEARKMMWPSRLVMWGAQLHAEWAVPIPIESNLRKLFITNLSSLTTREILMQVILEKTRNSNSVVHVSRQRNYAIVQFTSRQNAQAALDVLTGATIDGNKIQVQWMRNKQGRGAPNPQQNSEEHPRGNWAEATQKQNNKNKHTNRFTQRTEMHNSSRFQPQTSQDNPPNLIGLQTNSSEPSQPLVAHPIYIDPSDGLAKPLPDNPLAGLLPPVYFPPGCPMPFNSFTPDSFRPFVASTPLQVPILNPCPEVTRCDAGVEHNNYFPPPNLGGPPMQMFVPTSQHLQYPVTVANFNGDVQRNNIQTTPYFVPIPFDGAGGAMINNNEV